MVSAQSSAARTTNTSVRRKTFSGGLLLLFIVRYCSWMAGQTSIHMVVAVVFYDNTIIRGCGGQMVDGEEKAKEEVGKLILRVQSQ